MCVIALSFALYAALRDLIGPAWASTAVAGAFALVALILAFFLTRKANPKPVKGDQQNLTSRLIELARERPLVAAGAMAAAVAVVVRKPRILTAIATAAPKATAQIGRVLALRARLPSQSLTERNSLPTRRASLPGRRESRFMVKNTALASLFHGIFVIRRRKLKLRCTTRATKPMGVREAM